MPPPATAPPTVLPYGSWPTPITSEVIVRAAAGLSEVRVDGGDVWWSEQRPEEGGRTQLVRLSSGAGPVDVLPEGWNARTAADEYGGGSWWVRDGRVWFANWADQRLYRVDPGGEPMAVTAEPEVKKGDRWADGDVSPDGRWLLCVRERHRVGGGPADAVNEIVRLRADGDAGGSGSAEPVDVEVVVTGPDFVSNPRWSPDGRTICWLEWDHPNMPWDATHLMVRDGDGDGPARLVAGGDDESVEQPRWHEDGSLWFISDRTGWWNLYRWTADAGVESMVAIEGEIGVPQWVFGQSRYAFLPGGRVAFGCSRNGVDNLMLREADGSLRTLDVPFSTVDSVVARDDEVVFVGASPTTEAAVVSVDPQGGISVLRPPRDLGLPAEQFSVPESIEFPTGGGGAGATAFGLFYPPVNPGFTGPPGSRPPLLVMIHGGPTASAIPALRLSVQYWTSRGFAVVDVNYRGSTGFGRTYRNLLQESWGVADVEDCMAAARWLAEQGRVDPERLCIRGGSAGGFTTLLALAAGDVFSAGASHYGVADLEALAKDTHKFESRYLDGLIGPYPERRNRYVARSPIHHLDAFDRPLIVLQGLDDPVVPPSQSEMIVAALRDRRVPVAYVAFEGEQHGFRQAPNIRRALESELSFYGQILGFELPAGEGIEPVPIERG